MYDVNQTDESICVMVCTHTVLHRQSIFYLIALTVGVGDNGLIISLVVFCVDSMLLAFDPPVLCYVVRAAYHVCACALAECIHNAQSNLRNSLARSKYCT